MGNREPGESDITTFKKGRPVEFPLLRGWAEKLHHVTHDNHDGKDARSFAGILRTVSPDEESNLILFSIVLVYIFERDFVTCKTL